MLKIQKIWCYLLLLNCFIGKILLFKKFYKLFKKILVLNKFQKSVVKKLVIQKICVYFSIFQNVFFRFLSFFSFFFVLFSFCFFVFFVFFFVFFRFFDFFSMFGRYPIPKKDTTKKPASLEFLVKILVRILVNYRNCVTKVFFA